MKPEKRIQLQLKLTGRTPKRHIRPLPNNPSLRYVLHRLGRRRPLPESRKPGAYYVHATNPRTLEKAIEAIVGGKQTYQMSPNGKCVVWVKEHGKLRKLLTPNSGTVLSSSESNRMALMLSIGRKLPHYVQKTWAMRHGPAGKIVRLPC